MDLKLAISCLRSVGSLESEELLSDHRHDSEKHMSQKELGEAAGARQPTLLRTSLLYQRLEALGLSGHVNCWFLRRLDGSAGALVVDDRTAFLKALIATGRFCEDSSKGGILHGGHRSFREMAAGSVEALHFTAANGDYLWVHLDSVSPSPNATLDGRCRYRSRQAAAHIRRDVVPLFLHRSAAVSGSESLGNHPARAWPWSGLRKAGRAELFPGKSLPVETAGPFAEQRGWLRELC